MSANFDVRDADGATISMRAPEKAGKKYQTVVLDIGGEGAENLLTDSLPVTIPASELHLGEVGGKQTTVSIEFTREANATPYGVGDVISSSAASPLVNELQNIMRVNGGTGYITKVEVVFNVKSVTPTLRLNFFNAAPTISGDNLAHKELYADNSKRLGYIDFEPMATAADSSNSDMSRAFVAVSPWLPVAAAIGSRSLYVSLQTMSAVTLTSGSKVTITVTVDNN